MTAEYRRVADLLSAGEEMSVDFALAAVQAQRPNAQPNAGFMRQLVDYEASLRQPLHIKSHSPAVDEAGTNSGHVPPAARDTALQGVATAADPASSMDSKAGKCTGNGHAPVSVSKEGKCHSNSCQSIPQTAALAGSPPMGLTVGTCSMATAEKSPDWAERMPASPQTVCGATFLPARCGSDGAEAGPDTAASPQSSVGGLRQLPGHTCPLCRRPCWLGHPGLQPG